MSKHLIIMAKPPIWGKVKTRLATSIGEDKALDIYKAMLDKTYAIAEELNIPTTVFFTEQNEYTKNFILFNKEYQVAGDLGIKMMVAFSSMFEQGYDEVIMIGTDCPDNSSANLNKALSYLKNNDVVFGPSLDGGYYLIGMTKLYRELFENKIWSTDIVYQEALEETSKMKLKTIEVETINDIDTEEDLKKSKFYKFVRTID